MQLDKEIRSGRKFRKDEVPVETKILIEDTGLTRASSGKFKIQNSKFRILLPCCLLVFMSATAQYRGYYRHESRHELSIYGMGGYSPVKLALYDEASASEGSISGSMGAGAGFGYTFNINSSVGIVTGLEVAMYGAEISYGNITSEYIEGAGEQRLQFSYSLNEYKEKQSIAMVSIPLMAQYSSSGYSSTKFYASGGFKLGFPALAKVDINPGAATTSGHYTHEGITYENLPQHSLVIEEVLPNIKQDLKPGFSAALALEMGARFNLSYKIDLYAGAYLDYGLNSIQKTNDRHLLEYDSSNETTFKYNSLLDTGLLSKANLLSAGLKLRIGFKL